VSSVEYLAVSSFQKLLDKVENIGHQAVIPRLGMLIFDLGLCFRWIVGVTNSDDMALIGKDDIRPALQLGPCLRVGGQGKVRFRAKNHVPVNGDVFLNPAGRDGAVSGLLFA